MNSKEALEKIKERLFLKENDYVKTFIPCILKISQDLDRLETFDYITKQNVELREKVNHFKNVKNRMRRNCKFYEKENTKLKKIINILKIKRVSIHILLNTNSVGEYNFCVNYDQLLTQEEYELLKEVLGNE